MTEHQLRALYVETAKSYLGCKESDGSHKKIIDLYNTQRPLPAGYKVQYNDAWCATFVSAIAVQLGLTDIVLPECSCNRMIALYQKAGRWTENDAYAPNIGDLVMYDWDDSGVGDNRGQADHVGIICSLADGKVTVIEGNKSNAVGFRTIAVNGRYIRGYCLPNFAAKAAGMEAAKDWAAEAKAWAVENGLIAGTGKGSDGKIEYAWDGALTRAQLVTVLHRFAKLIGKA